MFADSDFVCLFDRGLLIVILFVCLFDRGLLIVILFVCLAGLWLHRFSE